MKKTDIAAKLTELEVEFDEKATKAELEAILAEHTEEATGPKSIVPLDYKAKYKAFGGTCGDEMAEVLTEAVRGESGKVDQKLLENVMAQNNIERGRWNDRNVGQRRMNLGNVLRARIKRGEFVQVGEHTWNKEAAEAVA